MVIDLWNIICKEWKEFILLRGGKRSGLFNLIIVVLLIGVVIPLQSGNEWINSPSSFLIWSWMPLFMVMGLVADSFAGERERHTLETLLASRLSDHVILFGKMLAVVLYGWGMTIVSIFLGAVTINIAFPEGGLRFYPSEYFLAALGFSLLVSLLISALGVLISLDSATVRQASQKMSIGILVLWAIPMIGLQFLPEGWKTQFFALLKGMDLNTAPFWVAIGLVVIDAVLIMAAMTRFRGSRLMLD